MKKSLTIIAGMITILVVAFFAYDLIKGIISPCETIFQQTSIQLKTKLKLIETEGDVFVGKDKIQDLTDTAQVTALNLKTCCIVLNAGDVDSNQFLQCKDTAKKYEEKVDSVLAQMEEARTAKKAGKPGILEEKVRAINQSVDEAKHVAEEIQSQVNAMGGEESVTPQTPKKGKGKVITSEGSFVFDRIKGMSMSRDELTVSQFGSKVEIPLSTISKIKFLQDNLIRIEYRNGQAEDTKFFCYWNLPATFYSGDKKIYYGDCTEFRVVEEIEFHHTD